MWDGMGNISDRRRRSRRPEWKAFAGEAHSPLAGRTTTASQLGRKRRRKRQSKSIHNVEAFKNLLDLP